MPPKAPNLKFKPKLVSQSKQQSDGASATGYEELSAVQLERLRRAQDGAAEDGITAPSPAHRPEETGAKDRGTRQDPASSAGRHRNEHTSAVASTGGDAWGSSQTATHATSSGRKSAAAQLHEATGRYFDMAQYGERAEGLPVNTINDILGDGGGAEDAESDGQPRIYRPTPIASVSPRGAAAAVDAAPQRAAAGAAPKEAETDGVAFLRAAADELEAACAANKQFYEALLAGGATTSSAGEAGHLTWMQLPRFHGQSPPFVLQELPPGRVGELKVLRSGRVVLEIAGVHYDVWVDGDGRDEGPCSTVAVTQPAQHPMDPDARASCYEVGRIEKKLVCTPTASGKK